MAENKVQDYFDDDNDGHVKTAREILNVKIPTSISVATWVLMYRDNDAG
jgi:hypothetical protein